MKRKRLLDNKRPRIAVYRSNQYIYAQIIDDGKHITLVASDDRLMKEKNRIERAFAVGEALAKKAIKKGISNVRFDKRAYRYHGRVKSLAEGARKGGLVF